MVCDYPKSEQGKAHELCETIVLLRLHHELLANVSVHQIRPTQRTFNTSITSKFPVNELPTSAVGFGWHVLFALPF